VQPQLVQLTVVVKVQQPKHPLGGSQLLHVDAHLRLQPRRHIWPQHAGLEGLAGADGMHLQEGSVVQGPCRFVQ
jgi:hypothetical protein